MPAAPRGASAWRSDAGKRHSEARHSRSFVALRRRARIVQRLKTRAQFQAVMAGATVSRTAHFALHRVALDAPVSRTGSESGRKQALFVVHEDPSRDVPYIGVMLPKRWAKRAVTRNAIKRQVYAVSDALNPPLPAAAHVVRLRAGFDRAQFLSATSPELKAAVRRELGKLFERASA